MVRAGALLHMDAKQLPVFDRPGHWAHGNRFLQQRRPAASRQIEFAHVVIDDHTRLAYVEVHRHDRGEIAAQVLRRAARWMREQGAGPVEAVMTDNAFVYTDTRAFAAALADLGARHIRTPPRTPRWNGKAERFIRTLDEEWAHGRVWPTAPDAIARWHPSFATTTAADRTPHSVTGHPSAAFTKSAGRTPSVADTLDR